MSKLSLSSRIEKSPIGGPQPYDDPHRPATGRAAGDDWVRVDETRWLATAGVCLQDQQAEGVGRDGTACMHQAEVADFHKAVGQDMLEEPTDKLNSVEARGAWTCTSGFAVGEGHGAVRERDDTAIGDRHFEDIRGEVLQGGVGVWMRLAVDVPGDVPDLWIDLLQQTGLAHVFLKASTVDG